MSKLWMRYGELNLGGRVLTAPPMNIEFEEEFSIYTKSTAKIKIFNPSKETVAEAKKKNVPVTMSAGYVEDYGTCFTGEIFKHEFKAGSTSELTIEVSDRSDLWSSAIVNRSWRGPISATAVIKDLLSQHSLTGRVDVTEDMDYSRGISFAGRSLSLCLKQLAKDTKSELFFRNGNVLIIAPKKGYQQGYYLSTQSGLLTYEETSTGYKIKTLFLYLLGAGSLAKLALSDGEIDIKVTKGTRRFSVYGDAGVEFEAVRI